MGEIIVLVILPFVLFAFDYLWSVWWRPSIWPYAMRSVLNPSEAQHWASEKPNCFLFVIQNNEAEPVEWTDRRMRVVLRIRGKGRFMLLVPVKYLIGPNDEVTFSWLEPRKELLIEIPRIRPLKTWTFVCFVEPEVTEMGMELQIPTHSRIRQLWARVSQRLFQGGLSEYHRWPIIVRNEEDHALTSKPFRRDMALLGTNVVTVFLYALALWLFDHAILEKARKIYSRGLWDDGNSLLRLLLQPYSLIVDAILFIIVLSFIYWLAQTDPLPIAQGYQEPVYVKAPLEAEGTPVWKRLLRKEFFRRES